MNTKSLRITTLFTSFAIITSPSILAQLVPGPTNVHATGAATQTLSPSTPESPLISYGALLDQLVRRRPQSPSREALISDDPLRRLTASGFTLHFPNPLVPTVFLGSDATCSLQNATPNGLNALAASQTSTGLQHRKARGAKADDLEGALLYEFNMTKDPATGRIPEGIFEAEQAQANALLQEKESLDLPDLGSYTFVGPDNLGGRTRTIAYDVRYNGTTNRVILAGGVSGGVYKSIDDGATWVRKSPTGQHFSCTSIAQDPRPGSQDTWYYTVGEPLGNSASAAGAFYLGNGVYKSTDNGETWTRLSSSNTGALESFDNVADLITKVAVDPTNGNVYIAAVSAIRRSTDGGATWGSVLSGTFANSGQATDVAVTSTGRLYAAFAGTNSVGADGVWTSTTGASGSWTRIAGPGGTPVGWNANDAYGRVVLAIAPSSENLVYALYYSNFNSNCAAVSGPEAELFRWNNTTSSWTDLSATLPNEAGCLNGNDPFAVQGGYDLVVAVKPDDPATLFIGGTNIYRSTTSGTSWTRIGGYNSAANYAIYPNSHPDIHSIVFQPNNPLIMLCGNDGGIQRTTNDLAGTVTWTQINSGYRTYQYYHVVNDPRAGNNKVLGGAQDNGTTRNVGGAGSTFELVFGGDGVSVALSDPAVTGGVQYEYVGFQNGNIFRRNATLGQNFGDDIRPSTATASGLFVTLFKLDPDNTQTLYYANTNNLFRTTSASTVAPGTWTSLTGVATSVGANTITAIGLSRGPYSAATSSLFIGTSNGKVFRLDNPTGVAAGTAPVDITGANFPPGAYVSSISANPTNDNTVLVTFSNYGVTSVFWTGNANVAAPTWTGVEGSLTLPSYRSSAIVDTGAGGLQYFVGTSAGLYHTSGLPGAPAWTQEGAAVLGNAVTTSLDLRASDNKLLVGTHGYAMWSANIATPTALQLTAAVSRKMHSGLGPFNINLPLSGEPGVECRDGGGNHALVFSFTNNVVSGNANVTSGTGVAGSPTFAGSTMTVPLTSVADVQKITVTLTNVTDTFGQVLPPAAVSMNVLVGDTNGNKTVNTTDIAQTKAQSGAPVTNANFRQDVTPNGSITASDIGLVKSRSGATVP